MNPVNLCTFFTQVGLGMSKMAATFLDLLSPLLLIECGHII